MTAQVQLTAEEAALVIREATALAADRMLAEALLTREQAAKMLGVTTVTLNRIPAKRVKIGSCTRYRMADLKTYLDSVTE